MTPDSEAPVVREIIDQDTVVKKKGTKYIDHLTEDPAIMGQKWVCISFLSPEGIKNCKIRGIKIRGVFPTHKEAKERAKEIRKFDPDFHVFVGEMGKWLPQDPDPNSVKNQEYQEKELNDLMKSYKDNQEKAKLMHQERVEEMKRDAMEKKRKQEIRNRLKQKLDEKKEAQDAEKADKAEKSEKPYVDPKDDDANISTLGKSEDELPVPSSNQDVKDIERQLREALADDDFDDKPKKVAGKSKTVQKKRFKKVKTKLPTNLGDITLELKKIEDEEKRIREEKRKLNDLRQKALSAESGL